MEIRGRLTDVVGLLVGHWSDTENVTGCTVVLCQEPCTVSVDVRGGAPGTRETDLLAPGRLVEKADAIVLSGGSAFGLAAADGVMRWLHERGRGYPTAAMPVPIVPAAIIYDLAIGCPTWPGPEAGYQAAASAAVDFEAGSVGAGTGATVGKFVSLAAATKSGIGTASVMLPSGLVVSALVVVNALGNIVNWETGEILAGARVEGGGFQDFSVSIGVGHPWAKPLENTTIGVVATNAKADKASLQRVAQMAHDGLARAIRPVHTQFDGDTLFSLSTGVLEADLSLVGALAADVVAAAVMQAVLAATSLGGLPALRDLGRQQDQSQPVMLPA